MVERMDTIKSPDTNRIDEVLENYEQFIRHQVGYGDFLRHRNRYKSDVNIIKTFYKDGEILEIGSVPCHLTTILKLLGYPVIGVDLHPFRYQSIIDKFKLNIKKCDIERTHLPFSDGKFKFILFNEVIEHLRIDPLFALSEINRVLSNNGTLMLTTPNLYSIQQIVRFLIGRGFGDPVSEFTKLRRLGHMGHIREYSHTDIKRFLAANNFKIESVSYKHYYYPKTKRGMVAYILFHLFPSRFRSYQVVLAKKVGPANTLKPLF